MKKLGSLLFLGILLIHYSPNIWAQTYEVVALTPESFNFDAIADADYTSCDAMDETQHAFFSNTCQGSPGGGLPDSRAISAGPVTYNLQPYSGANALRITNANSGEIVLSNPSPAAALYFLCTSTDGGSTMNAIVNFSDGTIEQIATNATVDDWFNGASDVFRSNGRINKSPARFEDQNSGNPRLYSYSFEISPDNQSKDIRSVNITKTNTGGSKMYVFAVAREIPSAATANDCGTNQIVVSTGYNHNEGAVFSYGSQDPYWILTQAPEDNGSVNLNGPAFVIDLSKSGAWYRNLDLSARYLSAFRNQPGNKANMTGTPYKFKRGFCFCNQTGSVAVNYSLKVRADNKALVYFEDSKGNRVGGDPLTCTGFADDYPFTGQVAFNLNTDTKYFLVAELRNDHVGSPMGLYIQGTLTTTGQSFSLENECNNKGYVTGFAYADANCNDEREDGEAGEPGKNILLESPEGQKWSAQTDPNGYYTFAVPPGYYDIHEVLANGQNRASGSITVLPNTEYDYDFPNCPGCADSGSASASPWEMHDGKGILPYAGTPWPPRYSNADPQAFKLASIPGKTEEINGFTWSGLPPAFDHDGDIQYAIVSTVTPLKKVNFTYFRKFIEIPAGSVINEATVAINKVDDGARVYVFNSASPNGRYLEGQDARIFGGKKTLDLRSLLRVGEINTIVIVHVDDNYEDSELYSGLSLRVNDQEVPVCQWWKTDHPEFMGKSEYFEQLTAVTSATINDYRKPDFSKPDNVWEAGYGISSGADFTPFDRANESFLPGNNDRKVQRLSRLKTTARSNPGFWWSVAYNITDKEYTDGDGITYPPKQDGAVVLHPGNANDNRGKVRYTAPLAGKYRVKVTWRLVDSSPSTVRTEIWTNESGQWQKAPYDSEENGILSGTKREISFDRIFELQKGEMITFEVERDGNYAGDSTLILFDAEYQGGR